MPHTIIRQNLAGRDLIDYMVKILPEKTGLQFDKSGEFDIARQMKEKCC